MYVYHLSTFTNVALTVGLNSNGFTSQIHLVQIPPPISHSLSLSLPFALFLSTIQKYNNGCRISPSRLLTLPLCRADVMSILTYFCFVFSLFSPIFPLNMKTLMHSQMFGLSVHMSVCLVVYNSFLFIQLFVGYARQLFCKSYVDTLTRFISYRIGSFCLFLKYVHS